MIEKIIQKLTLLLVISFPIGLLLRLKLSTNVYVVPQDILVGLIFLLTAVYFIKKRKIPKNNFVRFQLVFVFIGVASLLLNCLFYTDVKLIQSILYPLRYLFYLSIFVAPLSPSFLKRIGSVMLFSGIIIILMGYWQFFFYYDLYKLFYLGWDNHLYRMFSSFLDPNFAGVFFVMFFFYLFTRIGSGKFEAVYKEIILAFCTVIAIYLTFSRTALVSLLVGIVSYAVITKKIKQVLFVGLLMIAFLFLISDTHVEGLNPLRTASTSKRIDSVKESIDIISKNPIGGVGFNAFRYAQLRYGYRNEKGASWSNADAGTDNSFLFAFVTTGSIGVIVYIFSWFLLGKEILTHQKKKIVILFPTMIALIVGSLFTNVLFYTPILTFWFLMARVMGIGSKADK